MTRHVHNDYVVFEYDCNSCNHPSRLQANFDSGVTLEEGNMHFPDDSRFTCPSCGVTHDLSEARNDLEEAYWESIKR